MRKLLVILLALLLLLWVMPGMAAEAIDWDAITSGEAVTEAAPEATALTTQPAPDAPPKNGGVDWGAIATRILVWVISGIGTVLSALLVAVTRKYITPWLRDVIIPWLQSKGLLTAAQAAVKYAEAELGRHTGDDKWALALSTLQKQGYNIDSTAVVVALKSAWTELNIMQIAAGVKNAEP